ncbi:MAG: SAM-dependent methyltransferase [Tannerellaceae bacterium]|jgi:16S rRNA (cytidine1402-2'-O)-methyltransferase|nr:SAM-dependent methyltransferase [Tannerellaceae bacterium]
MTASLFLIPVALGDTNPQRVLPEYNREVVLQIKHFIVEDLRSARRFLKKIAPETEIDALHFQVLNKHTPPAERDTFLDPLDQGEHVGVLSEAGCPAVADPGAEVVALAQKKHHPVVPLVGPSSILLSLMASGFNGQNFAFNGYLPLDARERALVLKKLESRVYEENQTQLFIETPYRNNPLLNDLLRFCRPSTRLCIASNLTTANESIRTLPLKDWESQKPDLAKQPTIFLLYK